MVKVMLKKPVTSGYDQNKQLVDKLGLFLLVQGSIDDQFIQKLGEDNSKWWRAVTQDGNRIVIALNNIAYLEEVSADNVGR